MSHASPEFAVGSRVRHPELGEGVVIAAATNGFFTVYFREHGERQVRPEDLGVRRDEWSELVQAIRPGTEEALGACRLGIEAASLPFMENSAALTSAKIDLLPHQIVLVHRIANADPRRFLIADEVGLGKTIETALILRELASRGELERAMMIVPAGLVDNWRHELNDVFHLDFEVFGVEGDVTDRHSNAFAKHNRLIASVDTLKQTKRIAKILEAPPWDLIVFDEAHHLSAYRNGNKTTKTQNYKLAEAIRGHARDLLLLSATPHQGDHFRFWMLVRLLQQDLFSDVDDMLANRYRLNAAIIRRTKADACDAKGGTLFARRLVNSECFSLNEQEMAFYDELLRYLQDGYNLAAQQGNKGRALGFVMTIFQKIAASSFAAIRSTLERRRLMLTIQEVIDQDDLRNVHERNQAIELAKDYIRKLYGFDEGSMGDALVEQMLAKHKMMLLKHRKENEAKIAEREGNGDEVANAANEEAVLYLAANALPEERTRINNLLALYPRTVESKCQILIQALQQIWAQSPDEKIVVFATYLGTVESIQRALEQEFPEKGVDVLKGGDHGAKTAAQKRFKRADGPHVLVCTAAGREGINLQFARILFNYDLPWNPMDIEQRIGRIHRYGQRDTAQVYNIVATNTIEGRIYLLLEDKLRQIAATLGKVDEHGEIAEDLRGQILGQLAAELSYDKVYREAISDPTLVRTRQELDVAMSNADKARRVVFELFQDLDGFNLGDYRKLDDNGRNMARLVKFLREAAFLAKMRWEDGADGEFNLVSEDGNRRFTSEREKALKDENLQLVGLEHPLVTRIMAACREILAANNALLCLSPVIGVSGCLGVWDVSVAQPGGKMVRLIQRIGVSTKGERETRFEKIELEKLKPASQQSTVDLVSLQAASRNLLNRAIEFSGLVGEGATYSARPLAVIGLV